MYLIIAMHLCARFYLVLLCNNGSALGKKCLSLFYTARVMSKNAMWRAWTPVRALRTQQARAAGSRATHTSHALASSQNREYTLSGSSSPLCNGAARKQTATWGSVSQVSRTVSSQATQIKVTASCIARLKQLSETKGHTVALRVTVDGGGCSGFQYVFALERAPSTKSKEDNYLTTEGACVIIDDLSLQYITGSKIDYVEELISASFRVTDNPNSEQSCGCGVSFSAKA